MVILDPSGETAAAVRAHTLTDFFSEFNKQMLNLFQFCM
jgi:hypothetical protein